MNGRYAPHLRFARNVLIVDLVAGAVMVALVAWQGWTSGREATLAMFVAGTVLVGIAILPMLAGSLGAASKSHVTSGGVTDYISYYALTDREFTSFPARFPVTLLTAGLIFIGCAAVIAAVFL